MPTSAHATTQLTTVVEVLFGLAAATILITTLTGHPLPFLKTDRAAFIALVIVGIAFCGPGMKIGQFGWLNPFTLLGMLIGTATLILAGAVLFGAKVPLITGERSAIVALAVVMLVKVVISIIRGIVYRT